MLNSSILTTSWSLLTSGVCIKILKMLKLKISCRASPVNRVVATDCKSVVVTSATSDTI